MKNNVLPLRLPDITESIYAGFWLRLSSMLLDMIFVYPLVLLMNYMNDQGRNYYILYLVLFHIFFFIYDIYFVKRWGGTPGKMITNIKIISTDGKKAGWKEALLRGSVQSLLGIIGSMAYIMAIMKISVHEYDSLGDLERYKRVNNFLPNWYSIVLWLQICWFFSEVVVLLFNKRKRALHDFVANTVVIKKKYEVQAEHYMLP